MEFVFTCIYGASVVLPVLLLMTAEQRLPLCEFSEASSTLGRPVMSCCDQVHNCYWQNVLCLVLCLVLCSRPVSCVLDLRPVLCPSLGLQVAPWAPHPAVGAGCKKELWGLVGVPPATIASRSAHRGMLSSKLASKHGNESFWHHRTTKTRSPKGFGGSI